MTYAVSGLPEPVISHVGPKQARAAISLERMVRVTLALLIIAALVCVGYGFFVVTTGEDASSGKSPGLGTASTEEPASVALLTGASDPDGPEVRAANTGAAAIGAALDGGDSGGLASDVRDLSQRVDRVFYAVLSSQVFVILVVGMLAYLGRGASRLKHS